MYGFVNKFVVRKTGLEVVESYLNIYARIELNRASCLYRCFLKNSPYRSRTTRNPGGIRRTLGPSRWPL